MLSSLPPFEVVIPAWNAEDFLAETLDSLSRQQHRPSRVLVVDDHSTDRTADIARDRGAEVVRNPAKGVVAARNLGLSLVTTPFVAFVDADDLWDEPFSVRTLRVLEADPELAGVGTLVRPFGDGDLSAWWGPAPDGNLRVLTREDVWQHNPVTASAAMYRTAALRSVAGWREDTTPTDDYDLVLRLVGSGLRLGTLGERLASYRVRDGSWSSRAAASLASESRCLVDFAAQHPDEVTSRDLSLRLRTLWWRTLARQARYGQPLHPPVAFPDAAEPTLQMRLTRRLLERPALARATAGAWRGFSKSGRSRG